eukprot:2604919-Prymnesium_polylepis.1
MTLVSSLITAGSLSPSVGMLAASPLTTVGQSQVATRSAAAGYSTCGDRSELVAGLGKSMNDESCVGPASQPVPTCSLRPPLAAGPFACDDAADAARTVQRGLPRPRLE